MFPLCRSFNSAAAAILFFPSAPIWQQQSRADTNDVKAIIERSVEASERDWNAEPHFDCSERDKTADGSKTYEDLMIDGSPFQLLTAVNNRPLSAAEKSEQARKMQEETARRKKESPQDRARRIAKYQAGRNHDHALMRELAKAFDFTLVGMRETGQRRVYVLKALPRPGYQPPNLETRVLTGMEGSLWVDPDTFQWVKVSAWVTRPVSIAGFMARVEPGTFFQLEKAPVAPGIWLAEHFEMRSRAKILFAFHHRTQEDDAFFNCRRNSSVADGKLNPQQ